MLSTVKRAEDDLSKLVIRINNPLAKAQKASVTLPGPAASARFVTMNEERLPGATPITISGATLKFPVPSKKIVTIEVALAKAKAGRR